MTKLSVFLTLTFAVASQAFVVAPSTLQSVSTSTALFAKEEEGPMECFLVYNEEEDAYDLTVCTSEPEEYAWFNGIDPKNLIPTETGFEDALECVEGASPRGVPEWECRSTAPTRLDSRAWQ